MLFFAAILFLGRFCYADTCPNAGQTPLANNGINNYVIDWLELIDGIFIPFPFAIGQCTSHSLVTTKNYFHSCVNNVVSTQEYKDSKCTIPKGKPEVSNTIDYYAPGEVGYFECDGWDTYAELYVATNVTGGNACSNLQHIFAGLNGCVDDIEVLGQKLSIYCDQKRTLFEWFIETAQGSGRSAITDTKDVSNPGLQSSSQYPSNSEIHSSTMSPNMSSSFIPSIQVCDSDFYCLDWVIMPGKSCQRIASLQGTNIGIWGRMNSCQEQVSAAVGPNLALWISALVTIVFTLTH